MSEKAVRESLEQLIQAIHSAIAEKLKGGTLQPHYMRYFKWKATEFEYGDTGVKRLSRSGEEILKPVWDTNVVFQDVIKLNAYDDTHNAISAHYRLGEGQANINLHQLITKLAGNILEGKLKTEDDIAKYIDSFLRDLNDEEQEYRIEVQLTGVIIQPDSIQLDDTTTLRRPTREDFEIEVYWGYAYGQMRSDPTAILQTRIYAKYPIEARDEIDRKIAILRLFRVSPIQDLQYKMSSDSIIKLVPLGGAIGEQISPGKYLLTKDDAIVLREFWLNMKGIKLPGSAYPNRQEEKEDALSIAYERYGDSLEVRMLERRISSAVMGLEALYLGGGEQQEMSYRLRLRVGKLLSLIGYSAGEVQEGIKEAYEIRSKYVHGGIIQQKDKKKLEAKFGDLNEFSKRIMDYLRASIVALLKRPSKASLIAKIDDSFLDSKREEEIKELLFIPYWKE